MPDPSLQLESMEAPYGQSPDPGHVRKRHAHLVPWLLIGGLVLFFGVNNWLWLTENVTLTGWDRPRHLAYSLSYARMLSPLSIRALFDAMVFDSIRPPFFGVSAAILYPFFGWSADIATMVNILYMAVLLAATYGIGLRWHGRRLGMLGVALLACFPMFYAMSHYFYVEFALTAMVTLSVYLLLATCGFERRGASLLFGLVLGLGLLTKRTFSVFFFGPLLVVFLTSGLMPALWQRIQRRPRLYWKKWALALVGGFALAALWYFPNRDAVRALVLGDALFFIWGALLTLAIYFVSLPSAPLSNALAAFSLAATLASTWYLAHVEFVQRIALYGYGVNDPRGRTLNLDSLTTYLYYVRKLGNEHMSLLLFVLFLIVTILAAFATFGRRDAVSGPDQIKQVLHRIRIEAWVVLAWLFGAYLLLSFSIYQETRAFTPVLPAVALIFGAALLALPWRRLRIGLVTFVLLFGLFQCLALYYEPVQAIWSPRSFTLPLWGETSLPPRGIYLELPDEGPTDHGYWIHPDVLRRMEEHRRESGTESLRLGLVARTRQLNAGAFVYLILTEYPHLRAGSLLEDGEASPLYQRLFANEYVLVKPKNAGLSDEQTQTIRAIVDGSARFFGDAFVLEATYPLPDGDTAYLYRQRYHLPTDYPVEYISRVAAKLSNETRPGDTILLTPPELAGPFAARYTGPANLLLLPRSGEALADLDSAASVQTDASAGSQRQRVFLVIGDDEAGQIPEGPQEWLNQHAFQATHEWSDSLQILSYGTSRAPAAEPTTQVHALLRDPLGGDQTIELVGYDLPTGAWHAGDIIPLTLFWQAKEPQDTNYNVFVHLIDKNDQLVAQTDSAPVGGFRPTSSWQPVEQVSDRHGLRLSDNLPAGEYELFAGMYVPETGVRLSVQGRDGQDQADSVSLGRLTFGESP